jgi:FixJ family two-component response regulator
MLAAILEDDLLISEALSELFAGSGIEVKSYGSTDSALAECSQRPPDVLIADWCVPGDISTARLVSYLRELNPDMRLVLTSGKTNHELLDTLNANPGASFIPKPASFESLLEAIKMARQLPSGDISNSAIL